MSLSSIAQNSALRLAVKAEGLPAPDGSHPKSSPSPAGDASAAPTVTASGPLTQLVTYIPTETIAVYVAISTALGSVTAPPGKSLDEADFRAHWIAFGVVLVATALLALGLSLRAQRETRSAELSVPWFDVLAATAAFAVWALSLPGTPLAGFSWYDAGTWSGVILFTGTTVIATAAYIFDQTVSWEKTSTTSPA